MALVDKLRTIDAPQCIIDWVEAEGITDAVVMFRDCPNIGWYTWLIQRLGVSAESFAADVRSYLLGTIAAEDPDRTAFVALAADPTDEAGIALHADLRTRLDAEEYDDPPPPPPTDEAVRLRALAGKVLPIVRAAIEPELMTSYFPYADVLAYLKAHTRDAVVAALEAQDG